MLVHNNQWFALAFLFTKFHFSFDRRTSLKSSNSIFNFINFWAFVIVKMNNKNEKSLFLKIGGISNKKYLINKISNKKYQKDLSSWFSFISLYKIIISTKNSLSIALQIWEIKSRGSQVLIYLNRSLNRLLFVEEENLRHWGLPSLQPVVAKFQSVSD